MPRTENRFIYMLKGIACILVIFVHYPLEGEMRLWTMTLGRMTVPLFFIAAGRFMYAENGGYRRLWRKFFRLSGITLGVLAVYTLYSWIIWHGQGMSTAQWVQMKYQPIEWLRQLVFNDSMIICDGSYVFDSIWFLFALVWVHFAMIIMWPWRKDIKQAISIGLLAMFYICEYLGFSATVPILRVWSGDAIIYRNWLFMGLPFALIGVWISQTDVKKAGNPLVWWTIAACGLFIALREAKHFLEREQPIGIVMMTIALAVLAEYYPDRGSRLLVFVGKHLSANIYYWHVLLGSIIGRYVHNIGAESCYTHIPWMVLIAAVLLSLILYGGKRQLMARKKRLKRP